MYNSSPTILYGFHGTDREAALKILNHVDNFHHSNNDYDWLGQGIYFWENNLERAEQYAKEDSRRPTSKIKTPFVLGATIELGNCLDLMNQESIDYLSLVYELLKADMSKKGQEMPENEAFGSGDFDFRNRKLDCAVIRYACSIAKKSGNPVDSVRAAFIEGEPVYPGANFHTGNHIQVAVINENCIKGIFLPRRLDNLENQRLFTNAK